MQTIKAANFQLGDVVKLATQTDRYSHSTVIQIENGCATLFRPYVTTSDFIYTAGVIPYIGIEQFKVNLTSSCEFLLIERIKTPLK